MSTNSVQAGAGLAERVRAAQLPPPAERKRIREAAGVTLRDVAAELRVTPMTVSRWERGERPCLEQRAAYARLLAEIRDATAAPEEGKTA